MDKIIFLANEAAVIRYGQTKNLDKFEYNITNSTYSADSMCDSPANTTGFWNPGYIFNGLLKNLQPNTRYYYSYGAENVSY